MKLIGITNRNTAYRVMNMIAYGCGDQYGFNESRFLIRMRGLLPDGECLPEFSRCVATADVDQAAWDAAERLYPNEDTEMEC